MADEHPEVRYEPRDLGLGRLLALLIAGAILLVLLGYFAWRFLWWQEAISEETVRSPYALTPRGPTALPAEPRLEQLNRMAAKRHFEVDERLLAKEEVLRRYGPAEEKGFVHIPIEEAMEAVAAGSPGRALRARKPEPPPAPDQGLLDSGESNSGQMFRGEVP